MHLVGLFWIGCMIFNHTLLFRHDAMFEDLPLLAKSFWLLSGPVFSLLIVFSSFFIKRCSECHRWQADCNCQKGGRDVI